MTQRPPLPLRRVRLGQSQARTFEPGRSPDRITLAWMDEAGEPIFVEGPTGRPATVVVVWPTDERGYIISSELGLARAAIWELESGMEQRLQDLICAMPLELYDLRVRRGHVIQWPRTLRSSSWYRSLERTIDQLALGLSA